METNKTTLRLLALSLAGATVFCTTSCTTWGAGGTSPNLALTPLVNAETDLNLVPSDNRINYTLNGYTAEGKRKLKKLTEKEAVDLALTEAADLYNCDRLLDPRYSCEKKGKKIRQVTVSGRPARYREKPMPQVQVVESTAQAQDPVVYHVVKEGETLAKIAKTYKVTVGQIVRWNNLTNTNVSPGKKLILQIK